MMAQPMYSCCALFSGNYDWKLRLSTWDVDDENIVQLCAT